MVSLIKYKNIPLKNKPPTNKQPIPLSVVPPQESLTPLWNSPFYATPDEPADPRDCDRYSDSIYCGGFPWSWTPVGLEPSIVLDGCNVGIEVQPILGWTKLPPVQVVYRKQTEECREKPPSSLPPPKIDEVDIPPPSGTKEGCLYRVRIDWTEIGTQTPGYPSLGISSLRFHGRDDSYVPAPNYAYVYCWGPIYGLKIITRYGIYTGSGFNTGSKIYVGEQYIGQTFYVMSRRHEGNTTADLSVEESYYLYNAGYGTLMTVRYAAVKNKRTVDIKLIGSSTGYIFDGAAQIPIAPVMGNVQEIWCASDSFSPILPPPPPPPKRCDCTMSCCPSTDQNDQLLRSLIKKVDKLSSIVGVDDYPVSLPTSLISKDEGFLGNLIPNANQDVPSLTRFFAWYIERFDEIMGQWEIPIEVKDSDPTKPGDQPVGFRLPNMAEAIAEMFGLMLQTSINTQIGINMQTRTMLEVGQNKQQGFKSYMLVLAIADHLGFDYKEVKHKIPMLFDITQTQLDKLLVESEIEVSAVDYTDKEDLKIVLLELRQAAAIIKAVHWRKFDINSDIAQGVKDLIMGLVDTSDEVNDSKKDEEDGKDKFDDFLEDAERGFTTSSGITDTDHPYGRNYNERPRIKEIGQESPGV